MLKGHEDIEEEQQNCPATKTLKVFIFLHSYKKLLKNCDLQKYKQGSCSSILKSLFGVPSKREEDMENKRKKFLKNQTLSCFIYSSLASLST